jgi:hypothetical protein
VSKLGRKTPTRASELMDIATKFTSGQEAVEAIFRKDKQPQGRQPEDVPEASTQHGTKKKSQAKRDAADTDLVAAAEYKNPRKPPGGANLFDKMLKEPCPYHPGPVKHTLEECAMLRRHFHKAGPPAEGGRAHNNDKKEDLWQGSSPRSTTAPYLQYLHRGEQPLDRAEARRLARRAKSFVLLGDGKELYHRSPSGVLQ